jgi:hypothetical protein
VSVGDLGNGLTTVRPEQNAQERGTFIQVVYEGPDAATTAKVTVSAARDAVDELMRPYLDRARSDVDGARKAADDSAKALVKAVKKSGLAPDRYRVLYAEITRLQSELTAPTATRDRADILKAIDDRRGQLDKLTPDLVPFMAVQNAADQANRYLVQVRQTQQQAQARLTQTEASITPVTPAGVLVGKGTLLTKAVAMSGGVGTLLAVVILALREVLRQRRPITHLGPSRRATAVRAGDPPPTADLGVAGVRVVIERGDDHRQLR